MANTLGNMPLTVDTDITSFGAAQTLQSLPFAIRPYKIALVVASATSSAGTVTVTLPIGGASLLAPMVVPAGSAVGTILFADNIDNTIYWQDFAVTGVTATGTRLFVWYRV
jgi:hypothetical protein